MTSAATAQPSIRRLVQTALEAFRSDSSYAAEMVNAAQAIERKGSRRRALTR